MHTYLLFMDFKPWSVAQYVALTVGLISANGTPRDGRPLVGSLFLTSDFKLLRSLNEIAIHPKQMGVSENGLWIIEHFSTLIYIKLLFICFLFRLLYVQYFRQSHLKFPDVWSVCQ